MDSKLFTPITFGPLTLRNRTIRSAAFESMCPGNKPSQMLHDYHKSVADGGVGMTTIAYAAVCQSGLSFDRQLWMRPEIVPGLKEITDDVAQENMWRYPGLGIERIQHLLTHPRTRAAQTGTARDGQELRPRREPGP